MDKAGSMAQANALFAYGNGSKHFQQENKMFTLVREKAFLDSQVA